MPGDYDTDRRLVLLSDYPVLAGLAVRRTTATRLDGRACRYLYDEAREQIDWHALSKAERQFMDTLGIVPGTTNSGAN